MACWSRQHAKRKGKLPQVPVRVLLDAIFWKRAFVTSGSRVCAIHRYTVRVKGELISTSRVVARWPQGSREATHSSKAFCACRRYAFATLILQAAWLIASAETSLPRATGGQGKKITSQRLLSPMARDFEKVLQACLKTRSGASGWFRLRVGRASACSPPPPLFRTAVRSLPTGGSR